MSFSKISKHVGSKRGRRGAERYGEEDEKGGRKEEGEAVKRGKEEESWRKWGKGMG